MDEIKALELGVNDYLSKPFSLGVLKARMKRILQEKSESTKIVTGSLSIDQSTCKVYKRGSEISLSKLEYRLLVYLIENKNHILSKEQILEKLQSFPDLTHCPANGQSGDMFFFFDICYIQSTNTKALLKVS